MINCHLEVEQFDLNADDTRTLPLPLMTRFRVPSLRVRQPPIGIRPQAEVETRFFVFRHLSKTDKITREVRQNSRGTRAPTGKVTSSSDESVIVIL